ncbi:hypothetical protein BDFB_005680 [Asbolus verrucosus]|uniref:Tubulin polyglutamylase complex subunit 2 n=1 Tax=Asbolus verrucosus TaxID=1661398 RepID=A0A482W4R4_ASBVE|nr:hypothetical protein BDFB_005680 [Asbolus verrucosus]
MYLTETGMKIMAPHSKMFVLAKLDEENCVVMAHFNLAKAPNFWLYYKMKIFYLLCEDFTTYFRMALAYLGVPGWQLAVLKASLPEWSAELFQILAPGILDNRQLFENQTENNVLDANIFNVTDDGKPSTLVSKSFVEEKKGVGSVSGKFKRKSAKGRFKK